MPLYPSNDTLEILNTRLDVVLKDYLDDGIGVRFDMPDPEEPPTTPTISVFLYDIQEDLAMRHGEGRKFDAASGKLLPGYVNVRCCYLLTYWGPISKSMDGPSTRAISDSLKAMNQVLNALINTREVLEIPGSYTRVIPPSEQLNSLGNFWQSLGNKPRLCLSYSVTVPIKLTVKEDDDQTPIVMIEEPIMVQQGGGLYQEAAQALWNILYTQLRAEFPRNDALQVQLSKVVVRCAPPPVEESLAPRDGDNPPQERIDVFLSGVTSEEMFQPINSVIDSWQNSPAPLCVVQGVECYVNVASSYGLVHPAVEIGIIGS